MWDEILSRLQAIFAIVLEPSDRLFWGYLLGYAAIALMIYIWERRAKNCSFRGFFSFILPRDTYRHPSALMDVKLRVVNGFLQPGRLVAVSITLAGVTLASSEYFREIFGGPYILGDLSLFGKIATGMTLFVLLDFLLFFSHYLSHRVPFLWAIHKVHHSAERLNPLTSLRQHPLGEIISYVTIYIPLGIFAGLMGVLFADDIMHYQAVLAFWLRHVLFDGFWGNMRHSHIWLSWGRLGYLFISPAQHQIHHSKARSHLDRNLGSIFAIWDLAFGTLYVPREKETLEFGLNETQPYPNLSSALVKPILESGAELMRLITWPKRVITDRLGHRRALVSPVHDGE